MGKGKANSVTPSPTVGEYVLIGYGGSLDPHFWWMSEVAWTDGETILIFDGTGSHPSRAPHLGRVGDVVAFGTKDHCFEVMCAANRVAREHDALVRDANVAASKAKDAARDAVLACLSKAGPANA